jgi:hypothetical protein
MGDATAAGEAAANREVWTRANREYADDHAYRAWAAEDMGVRSPSRAARSGRPKARRRVGRPWLPGQIALMIFWR